jgi:hypothetical protein
MPASHVIVGGIGGTDLSFQNYSHPRRVIPATLTLIVLAVLMVGIYFQVRDRFRDPEIKTTEQAEHSTTGTAVRSAGAQLSPTQPKLSAEPEAPKVVQPADHPAPDAPPK